jgi:5-methylcytosine-specific restriction endonuclease McrA
LGGSEMNNDKCNPFTRDLIFKKYNGRCAYCGVKITRDTFHVDHITPLKRNSYPPQNISTLNKIENYNPSCVLCNTSKNSFTVDEWRTELFNKMKILNRGTKYTLLKRFGLVKEVIKPIVFYFEKINSHG